MSFIRVSPDGRGFENADGTPFVPVGTNYANTIGGYTAGDHSVGYSYLFGVDEFTLADGLDEVLSNFKKIADLGLNVIRLWLEPDEFFPFGYRLDPTAAKRFDRLLDECTKLGLYVSIGISYCPIPSGWILHPFERIHNERHRMQLRAAALRWKDHPNIFSWTIVGEGTLVWQTQEMAAGWPEYLRYWYNDDFAALKAAWPEAPEFRTFQDAPIPPPNVGVLKGVSSVTPGTIDSLPDDPYEHTTWRYDWRLYLEEIGSKRVALESDAIRSAGAKQMICVGNNSWCFPGVPANQMARGYNPYFYADSVDYVCQHNYPAPQCVEGGWGDPLSDDVAMQKWLRGNQAMGRIYSSLGMPVVLEEFGWYGGTDSKFLCPLPYRSEEEQARYNQLMMETTVGTFSGWFTWPHKDMPKAGDITNGTGLWKPDGKTIKVWGKQYGEWAQRLQSAPPVFKEGKANRSLPMKALYTSDRAHVAFWESIASDWDLDAPDDFVPEFERSPMMNTDAFLKYNKLD